MTVQPVNHGTLVLTWDNKTIYVDPYPNAKAFDGILPPDLILITDIHGDHLNAETLNAIETSKAKLIVPQAVAEQLPDKLKGKATVLANGKKIKEAGITISAIPMYNLPEAPDSRHTKGRGNGYVLNLGGKTVYHLGRYGGYSRNACIEKYRCSFCLYESSLYHGYRTSVQRRS